MRHLSEQEVITINYLIIDKHLLTEPTGLVRANLLNTYKERAKQTMMDKDAYVTILKKHSTF